MKESNKDMMPHHIKAAVIACKEAYGIEPTQEQIEKAVKIAETIEKETDGIFMIGWTIKEQLLNIVAKENNLHPLNLDSHKRKSKRKRIGVTQQYQIKKQRAIKEGRQ